MAPDSAHSALVLPGRELPIHSSAEVRVSDRQLRLRDGRSAAGADAVADTAGRTAARNLIRLEPVFDGNPGSGHTPAVDDVTFGRRVRLHLRAANWRQFPAALLFSGGLLVVSAVEQRLPADRFPALLAWGSTNVENLRHHPIAATVVSAFLTDGYAPVWAALSLIGLVVVAGALGAARTVLLAGAVHVLPTLISEGILAARIAAGTVPPEARHVIDVGPSYVTVGALAAAIVVGTWPGRLLSAVGLAVVAPDLFTGLDDWGVGETGHACAIALGLLLGYLLRRRLVSARASEPRRLSMTAARSALRRARDPG